MNKKLSVVKDMEYIEREPLTRDKINQKYIQQITLKMNMDKSDLIALMKVLHLDISTAKATQFLSKLNIFRPEVIQDAMFNFYEKRRVDYKNSTRATKQFFRFLVDSNTKMPEMFIEQDTELQETIKEIGNEMDNINLRDII